MELRDIIVENPRGLHMRVAAEIVKIARDHGASVRISRDQEKAADGNSIMELLLLDAGAGTSIRIEVDGVDEKQIVQQISELFSDGAGI